MGRESEYVTLCSGWASGSPPPDVEPRPERGVAGPVLLTSLWTHSLPSAPRLQATARPTAQFTASTS